MRKIIILTIVAMFILLSLVSCTSNSYEGKYSLKTADGTILELKNDNSFKIYIEYGKNFHIISGKYSVTDNNINLSYNSIDQLYTNEIESGKVEGNLITFLDKNDRKEVFRK